MATKRTFNPEADTYTDPETELHVRARQDEEYWNQSTSAWVSSQPGTFAHMKIPVADEGDGQLSFEMPDGTTRWQLCVSGADVESSPAILQGDGTDSGGGGDDIEIDIEETTVQ